MKHLFRAIKEALYPLAKISLEKHHQNKVKEPGFQEQTLQETASQEAKYLITGVLSLNLTSFVHHLHVDQKIPQKDIDRLGKALKKRLNHEPLSRILGQRNFWKDTFFISPDTLDPRPETEGLVERSLSVFLPQSPLHILDLGTGSGCLLLSLLREFPHAWGLGIDKSFQALHMAQKNTFHLGLEKRASFIQGSWASMLKKRVFFDLIVTNPPYIPTHHIPFLETCVKQYDPWIALDGGKNGMTHYKELFACVFLLKKGGRFIAEIGHEQGSFLLEESRGYFTESYVHKDLFNQDRYLVCVA